MTIDVRQAFRGSWKSALGDGPTWDDVASSGEKRLENSDMTSANDFANKFLEHSRVSFKESERVLAGAYLLLLHDRGYKMSNTLFLGKDGSWPAFKKVGFALSIEKLKVKPTLLEYLKQAVDLEMAKEKAQKVAPAVLKKEEKELSPGEVGRLINTFFNQAKGFSFEDKSDDALRKPLTKLFQSGYKMADMVKGEDGKRWPSLAKVGKAPTVENRSLQKYLEALTANPLESSSEFVDLAWSF